MVSNNPLVSVIIPTTHNRECFNAQILAYYRAQDYANKEVLFDYGAGNVGEKRNRLCGAANGSIILHMDSDDMYTYDWITQSVNALISSGADIVGLSRAVFYDTGTNEHWQYTYPTHTNLHGATLCYRKSFWQSRKFISTVMGEDSLFCKGAKLFSHGYVSGFVATTHSNNTSPRNMSGERWEQIKMPAIHGGH